MVNEAETSAPSQESHADIVAEPHGSAAQAFQDLVPVPWDPERFHSVALLQEAPRNNGRVELCEDTHSGKLLAVKVMPYSWVCENQKAFVAAHPEENELPWRDISTTQYLSQVVGLTCVCEFVGLFLREQEAGTREICMALSYCEGGDLFSWLERTLPTTGVDRETAARPLMRRVLLAVRDIHSQGVAHGDLSLENVLLMDTKETDPEQAQIRVIDFGACTGHRAVGPRGKPSYQAPEVHTGLEYDACAADSFSVGVMLFTLTVGNYPWRSTRPHVCSCFRFAADRGFLAYLARRKIRSGSTDEIVTLATLLSPQLVSLLTGLLAIDGQSRLAISDALEHPWFTAAGP